MIKAISANPIRKATMALLVTAPFVFGACKSGNNNSVQQNQTEVVSKAGSDALKAIVLHDNSAKEPLIAETKRSIISSSSEENRKSRWDELSNIIKDHFTDEKINKYNDIIDRFVKDEKISDEEMEFYSKYDTRLATISGSVEGTVEGIISRDDINEKTKINELKRINYDIYTDAFPIYRRILKGIAKYYDGENLPKDKRNEIDSFLNKVTDGNYGIVVKDMKNGTTSKLKTPSKPY